MKASRPTPSLIPCPVGRLDILALADDETPVCPTMLQPYKGRLDTGVAHHLELVHQLRLPEARIIAATWVGPAHAKR